MTDRELLELAAVGAGYSVRTDLAYESGIVIDCGVIWNPLTDDGDALRLAVNLHIDIAESQLKFYDKNSTDPYAATRRAIVRAAAEIGKDMK